MNSQETEGGRTIIESTGFDLERDLLVTIGERTRLLKARPPEST